MDDAEAELVRDFGRAFRLMEACVEARLVGGMRDLVNSVFRASPEYRLARTLARAERPLPLYEIAASCGAGRKAVTVPRRLRLALQRMNEVGILFNVGTWKRPRYRLNAGDAEAKLFSSLSSDGEMNARVATPTRGHVLRAENWFGYVCHGLKSRRPHIVSRDLYCRTRRGRKCKPFGLALSIYSWSSTVTGTGFLRVSMTGDVLAAYLSSS